MSLEETAEVALRIWGDRETATIMTAIAGAESRWNPNASGDTPRQLRRAGYERTARLAESFNCPWGSPDGPASWGLWQVFMPVWRNALAMMGAPVDHPCNTARWLSNPMNNARMANHILRTLGLNAWTTYRTGAWRRYESQAGAAVFRAWARGIPSLGLLPISEIPDRPEPGAEEILDVLETLPEEPLEDGGDLLPAMPSLSPGVIAGALLLLSGVALLGTRSRR